MQTLLIISGTSGAGKTCLAQNLKRHYGNGQVLTVTTRRRQPHEAPEAYHFVNEAELKEMQARNETLWIIERYGNQYSITEPAIRNPLSSNNGLAFVIITPDYHVFLANWCRVNDIVPLNIHLDAPDRAEQKRRLINRDGEQFDRSRVDSDTNARFEADAIAASVKVEMQYIAQDTPEKMFVGVQRIVDTARA